MKKTKGTHNYYVYILTNTNKTVLYIGVTNNLSERLYNHHNPKSFSKSFTKRYQCVHLVYYERFNSISTAIDREKQLKKWNRSKKNYLITQFNSSWSFLNDKIGDLI